MHPLLASTALGLAAAWPVGLLGLGLGRAVERLTDDPRPRAAAWSLAYALPAGALAATVALTFSPLSAAKAPVATITPARVALAAPPAEPAWTPALSEGLAWTLVGLSTAGLLARGWRWNRGRRRLAAVRGAAQPCQDYALVEAVRVRAARLGVKAPRVRVSADIAESLLAGVRRPAILLPRDLVRTSDAARLELVCGHELAHLRRADNWRIPAEEALAGLFWLVPPVAALRRRMLAAREAACDLAALDGAAPEARRDYARVLVDALRTNALPAPQSAFTGRERALARMRLAAILQPSASASAARLGLVVALGGTLTALAGAGSLALAGQARRIAPPPPPIAETARIEAAADAETAAPVVEVAPAAEAREAQEVRPMARPAVDAWPMAQVAAAAKPAPDARPAYEARPASGPNPRPDPHPNPHPDPRPRTSPLQVISEMQTSAPSRREVIFLGDAAVTGRLDPVNVNLKINGAQASPRFQPSDLKAGQVKRLEITDQRVAVDGKITVNVVMSDAAS